MAEAGQDNIKTSKNPVVQNQVEAQKGKILEKFPEIDEKATNQLARSGVAARLRIARLKRDVSTQKREKEEATEEGRIDHQTQLLNRRGVLAKLDEEMSRSLRERKGKPNYFVVFMDVNNLKHVNDNHGHDAGDMLIKEAARILRENVRPDDVVGRWTQGDELIAFVKGNDPETARVFWERVGQEFQHYSNGKNGIDMIWISAGLSRLDPDNIESSIDFADRAMQLAKTTAKEYEQKTHRRINMMRTESNLQVPLK